MREIKFRIFTPKNKMEYHNLQELINWDNAYELGQRKKETDIMQFTGLLDKNGKEIYEGDVLRNEYDINPNQVIIFENGMFCLGDEKSPLWEYQPQSFWEIIGNIYEHPHLLEPNETTSLNFEKI